MIYSGIFERTSRNLFFTVIIVCLVAVPVQADLIAHWPLDDGSGTTAASAINSPADDGTLLDDAAFVSGAVSLDGSGDGVQTLVGGVIGAGARTVAAWIKIEDNNYNKSIVSWGDSWAAGNLGKRFTLKIANSADGSGVLRAEIGGGYAFGTTEVTDGTWHHVAVTTGAGDSEMANVKFYIDGVPDAVAVFGNANPINSEAGQITIGGVLSTPTYPDGNSAMWFPGSIADARVYNEMLGQSEITLLADDGPPDHGGSDVIPEVVCGSSYLTWLGNMPQAIDGTVEDHSEGDIADSDVQWSVAGDSDAMVTKTSTDPLAPTADFTATTAGTYTIQLTATDASGQTRSDILTIRVAEDACAAAQLNGAVISESDLDEDCDVDLDDFAALAAEWMSDIRLTSSLDDTQTADQKPNVIIIFLDDSGYGDYTHNGNPTIRTPNISKLAQDGVSFSQFYVTSPACSASRYSLMTGRYPARSGFGSWVIGPSAGPHLRDMEVTISEGLKARGYATGMFGKWHMGNPNSSNGYSQTALPLAHGFDTWLGTNVSHDYSNAMLMKTDPTGNDPIAGYNVIQRNLPSHQDVCDTLTSRCTAEAIDFIQANQDGPFFAYIAYNMPHLGLNAGDDFKGVSRRGLLGDVMEEIDDAVGQIRQTLADTGLTENTLIIFSSDNGPWIKFQDTASHSMYGEARLNIGYALPFRDGKGSTWEGGHRVPGIFCWPGTITSNVVEQTPASTLDVLPTVFALTGAETPTDRTIDGRDIRSLLMPNEYFEPLGPFTFLYNYSDNRPSAIRKGPWKLHIRIGSQTGDNYGFTASRTDPLLFQVEHDLGERIDRAAEEPAVVQELLDELEALESSL